jgi:hypothetical protein
LLEPAAVQALADSRAAEDRARDAREYARAQPENYGKIGGARTAEQVTEALIRADSADQVAADAEEAADKARRVSRDADDTIAELRDDLAEAERDLAAARKNAETPRSGA